MMRILVLGSPFSGGQQMYNMLRSAGYEVGFNTPQRDGMVKVLWPVQFYYATGYTRVYQIVSNPFCCIPIMAREAIRKTYSLRAAAEEWLTINTTIARVTEICLRAEYISEEWPEELYKPKSFSRFNLKIPPLTKRKLLALGDLGLQIFKLAKHFGYGE